MSTDEPQPPGRPSGAYDDDTMASRRSQQASMMQTGLNDVTNRGRRGSSALVRIYPDDDPNRFEFFYLETVLTTRAADAATVADFLAANHPELPVQQVADRPVPGVTTFDFGEGVDVTGLCDEMDAIRPGIAMPDHAVHVAPTGCCPATEPWPTTSGPIPERTAVVDAGKDVRVVVVDSGRRPDLEAHFDWLDHDITGTEEDAISAGHYVGHGTFVCGVLRTQAPQAKIDVNALNFLAGAVVESDLAVELWNAIHEDKPAHLISMSAGTTTRKGYQPIALAVVCEQLAEAGILLVAAAGNDSSTEHFYPAYFSQDDADLGQAANLNVVSVGALDSVRRLAWFSNYDWPTVYARGSEIVNAYPEGSYTYREPPLVGAPDQDFSDRLAIWDGTSFATPLVSGLIAARMTTHGESVTAAWGALFAKASGQRGLGSGPSLFPGDAA